MIPQIPLWVLKVGFALACVGALAIAVGVVAGMWWLVTHIHFS
jgi:hypothetical protein